MIKPEKLFDAYEPGGEDIALSGLPFFYVSVFDHWLTEDEAEVCRIFTYEQARDNEALHIYEAGERSFLSFYETLRVLSGVLANPERVSVRSAGEDMEAIFIRSLREQSLMDICFTDLNLRAVGGFDRTDLMIFGDTTHVAKVEALARDAGLYVLR
ncbi:UNVERIFIED_ORG: hypothetical protein J2W66_000190 [Agrobacterium larrymoorei]|nr:hypothetical protein [Agrobacterium larrymoorei]